MIKDSFEPVQFNATQRVAIGIITGLFVFIVSPYILAAMEIRDNPLDIESLISFCLITIYINRDLIAPFFFTAIEKMVDKFMIVMVGILHAFSLIGRNRHGST